MTGLALADLATGEFLAWEGDVARAREVLAGYAPREILHAEESAPGADLLGDLHGRALLSPRPAWTFAETMARKTLLEQFGVATLDGFGLAGRNSAVGAAGALISFLVETQKAPLQHVAAIKLIDTASCLVIDATTRRNLEVVRSSRDGSESSTLVEVLDLTMTAMGGRLLRDWLLRPLVDKDAIDTRLDAVGEMLADRAMREALREALRPLPDIERQLGRLAIRTATPRDLLTLRRCLKALPGLKARTAAAASPGIRAIAEAIPDLTALETLLDRAIAEDPPASTKECGIIREGFDPDVDRWRFAQSNARTTIAELEARERKRTGIGNLKIRYNNVFGYAIEVSKSNLANVPPDYTRKQTLVGAERFVTPELKSFEETLLRAESELVSREAELFAGVVLETAARGADIRRAALAIAAIDTFAAFAEAAERYGYVRPKMTADPILRIVGGRHPVVERIAASDRFIPNDLTLDSVDAQIMILTGPNMGGKSTYLRQTALIVLMAQAGGFVPAERAEIGIADRIFCRVGASDNLAGGQSTFLVEMSETANILHSATTRSLVLLDEIGRGTSTFDGLSIAWAVAEWLHENRAAKPRSLFATHYHELTELALLFPGIRNFHMSAREYRDTVLFLRRVEEGPADRSYGIQVARLAGLPRDVIARAKEVLAALESKEFGRDGRPALARRGDEPGGQRPLFVSEETTAGSEAHPLLETIEAELRAIEAELRATDADRLTPLEALSMIARWKRTTGS